uniref:Uncharacterized protein n=1 Tax=Caenorhabditis japonica TaxID=281687 RepID=A0A8R1IQ90_CAEJA
MGLPPFAAMEIWKKNVPLRRRYVRSDQRLISVGVGGESAGATSCSRSNCAGTILATAVEAAPDSVVIRNLLVRRSRNDESATIGVETRDGRRCECAWTSVVNEGRRRVRDRSVCAGEKRRTGKGLDAYSIKRVMVYYPTPTTEMDREMNLWKFRSNDFEIWKVPRIPRRWNKWSNEDL